MNQDIPECYYNLAYIYSQQGDNQLALDFYKKCLIVDEDYISAHINISQLYFVQGRMDAAKNHSNKALKINP
ncbi:tetratricopeptide repeat protein [Psychrobacillus sp. FSL K6-2836]|uniref:tetratricopeptide repeat protein n=1 Tax=Psychrobacillus sp. FSL K6-2836 TaxID=2921548 RepID=UPI0040406FA4